MVAPGIKDWLRNSSIGTALRLPGRASFAFSYYKPKLRSLAAWVFRSREDTNLTYDLTEENIAYLAHTVSHVVGVSYETALGFIEEARRDRAMHDHVVKGSSTGPFRHIADPSCHFGRRLGWYAFIRALKPKIVVETGVDKGHGAVIINAALLRNRDEGFPGRYYGTDINPSAGWLFREPYTATGEVLYGDSIESLRNLNERVDLFINDSDHSGEYEYQEYLTIRDKLSPSAVILGDNAHATDSLARFSREQERAFLFFKEVPKDHWYPGAGIGISFRRG